MYVCPGWIYEAGISVFIRAVKYNSCTVQSHSVIQKYSFSFTMIIDKERVRKRSKFFNSSASGQTEEEAYGRRDPRLARWRGAPKGRPRVQLVNETHLGTDQYFPFKKSCQNIFELFSTCQPFFTARSSNNHNMQSQELSTEFNQHCTELG